MLSPNNAINIMHKTDLLWKVVSEVTAYDYNTPYNIYFSISVGVYIINDIYILDRETI